jgi:hypothetical protein
LRHDFENMYMSWNVLGLAAALGVAAPLANTSADANFDRWYQQHVRGGNADHWGSELRRFGDIWIVVPVVIGSTAVAGAFPEYGCCTAIGDWGCRSLRGLIVGAPPVVIFQIALGSGQPGDAQGSAWHPKQGHQAVATEAYVGSVPLLTAAAVCKNPCRWLFFGGSFAATWACVHNDSHYLSQALLGWSIGAVATCSVNQTENQRLQVTPVAIPQGMGAGVTFRY